MGVGVRSKVCAAEISGRLGGREVQRFVSRGSQRPCQGNTTVELWKLKAVR